MNAIQLEFKFAAMGARMKVREIPSPWRQGDRSRIDPRDFAMDLRRDGNGQFFELRVPTHLSGSPDINVMQALPDKRHLLLAVRNTVEKKQLDRFLCGHDEREWFVAAVPGGASSVRQAMDALQPQGVREALLDSLSRPVRSNAWSIGCERSIDWVLASEATAEGRGN